MILDDLLNKLKLTWTKLTKEEKETFKNWEEVMSMGKAAEALKENEAFQKGLKAAEIRLTDLFNQLLDPDNSREKDIYIKAEINNILKSFAIFQGAKRQKEILEAQIKQRLEQ